MSATDSDSNSPNDSGILDQLESDLLSVEQALTQLDEISAGDGPRTEAIAAAVPVERFAPIGAQPVDARPADAQPVDAAPAYAQPVDARPADFGRSEPESKPNI